ncbi:hypothetical protein KFK09_023990 [Dendrobium nobile]|uniref:Uncharacterized protein n=1 Tax=Dendrobium nobile TaxID=94219 RepID=A0A8T3ACT7_DENNO|nr:hypothetical protein KFK09_023990 [Dendrobium nobile]
MEHYQEKGFEGDDLEEEISHHRRTSDEVMEYSSQTDNVRTFDSVRGSFSRIEMGNEKKIDKCAFVEKKAEVNYDTSASASFMGTFDDEANWVPSIGMHESGNHDNLMHNRPEIQHLSFTVNFFAFVFGTLVQLETTCCLLEMMNYEVNKGSSDQVLCHFVSIRSCPIDLKEAISSVIFASPRCADIPELMDARKQFVAKYGKEFVTSAFDLQPDCGVNLMIVEKLSAKTANKETKMKILTEIAEEHDVKWDSKAFDEELQKPKEDLLNGSSSFGGATKMSMEPLNINFPPNVNQVESASKVYQTEIPSKPTSFDSSSHANLRSTPLVPPPASNDSRESGEAETTSLLVTTK